MGYTKGGLSYFAEGDTTGTPSEQTTEAQPVAKAPATYITFGKNKVAMPAYTGTAAVGAGTLENMQKMLEQRLAQQGSFVETLKDMKAWTPGPRESQSQALQLRGDERAKEAADIFGMQNAIEQYKAQQLAQANFEKRRAKELGLDGTPGTIGVSAKAPTPFDMPEPVKMALANAKTEDEYKKIFNQWAQENAKLRANPEWAKDVPVKIWDGSEWVIDKMPLSKAYEYTNSNPNAAKANPNVVAAGNSLGGDISPKNIGYVESRNTPGAQGPEVPGQGTAKSEMQVMDATATNPGFGVKPAKLTGDPTNDEAERKRVGTEYFEALKANYKDPTLAAAAYVWGPGNVDAWIKNGAKLEEVPASVRDYVAKAHLARTIQGAPNALANAGQKKEVAAPAPATTSAIPKAPTYSDLEAEAKAKETYKTGTAGEYAKTVEGARKVFTSSIEPTSIAERSTAALSTADLLKRYPNAVGVLADPNFKNAVATVLKEGISTPRGHIGIKGIEDAIFKTMPEADRPTAEARYQIATNLARTELETSKLAQGQGTISDNERQLFQRISGGIGDPAKILLKKVQMLDARVELDRTLGNLYRDAVNKSGYIDFDRFRNSRDYINAVAAYESQLKSIAGNIQPGTGAASASKPSLDDRVNQLLGPKKTKQQGF